MKYYAVDCRDQVAQALAPDAAMDCPQMTPYGRFQYVLANSGEEAIHIASDRRREYHARQQEKED